MKSQPLFQIYHLPIPIPGPEAVSFLYLVRSRRTALIDTGPASTLPHLLSQLAELQIPPPEIDFILGSHIHLDHLGGLSQALKRLPQAQAMVHPRGVPHLLNPQKLWQASLAMSGPIARDYGPPRPVPPDRLIAAQEGQIIDLGGLQLEVLFTPGHAPHHLSFWAPQSGDLFAGEAAGIYFPDSPAIRPAAPPPFDPEQSLISLDKMASRHPSTIHYCHYGSAADGPAKLAAFRQGLAWWDEIIRSFFKRESTLSAELVETILDVIITQDGTKSQFPNFEPERLKSELHFLRNNIRGYWDYFQRKSQAKSGEN
jgi:glyoxylase-like metal-dependent hydrolase (beta-lactamase superfamily II)